MESIRDIAKRIAENYHRKYPYRKPISDKEYDEIVKALNYTQMPTPPPPAPIVEVAIAIEALNEKDRDWLERLGIRV